MIRKSGKKKGHWEIMVKNWAMLGPPLRPSATDQARYSSIVKAWSRVHGPPRALILGVTPELYHLPWPQGTHLEAADRSEDMIQALWPGRDAAVWRSDWTSLALPKASKDLVLSDNGINMLSYPGSQKALARTMKRIIAPGGLLILRIMSPSRRRESPEKVMHDLLAGKIGNLNLLKVRLCMALHRNPKKGVALEAVWETLHAGHSSQAALAKQIGWPLKKLQVINSYKNSPIRYYFPSPAMLRSLFCSGAGGFKFQALHTPRYVLGENCPILVLKRLA